MAREQRAYSVPALEKTILILNALSESDLTITDLYTQLELPKSTTFVILNTLEQNSIIQKTAEGKYCLGYGVIRWGISYFRSMEVTTIARMHLEKLVSGTPYTAHLATPVKHGAVYVDKVEGEGFVRFATSIGQIQKFHLSAVGKALAVDKPEDELANLLSDELSQSSLANKERILNKFIDDTRFVKKHGFSIEDEEFEDGIRCIGAPIRNYTGAVVASLSITALSRDLPAVKFITIGEQVKATANAISQELGFELRAIEEMESE